MDARLRAEAVPSGSRFTYRYRIENGPAAKQILGSFAVRVSPAGGSAPAQASPSGWDHLGEIARTGFYMWLMLEEPQGLAPGRSARGFELRNAELPAVVAFLAWGEVEPPSFPEGMAPESCEGVDVVENSFKGKTLGPKAPPARVVPLEFLNSLIALLHESRAQGWVRTDGVHRSLLAKLLAAKRALEGGRAEAAAGELRAFVGEAAGAGCRELACPGSRPLTSEAYALLVFNGEHLLARLGEAGKGR